MDVLARENPAYPERYEKLVVFPVDAVVPEAVIVKFWTQASGMNGREARKLLTILDSKQLIRLRGEVPNRHVSMHDLQHDYLRATVKNVETSHRQLIAAYQQETVNGRWHTLPDDGYIHAHLTLHMLYAGDREQIHALLQETDERGENGWYQTLRRHGEISGYLADVRRAWELAKQACESAVQNGKVPVQFSREIRYALHLSSIKGMAVTIPPPLIALCLEYDVLSWPHALSLAEMHIEPRDRALALLSLTPYAPVECREKLLASVVTAAYDTQHGGRIEILSKLAIQNDLPHHLVDKIFEITKNSKGIERSDLLSALASRLGPNELEEAIALAREIEHPVMRVNALSSIAKHLCTNQSSSVVSEMIECIKAMDTSLSKIKALCTISAWWVEAIEQALNVSEQILLEDDLSSVNSNGQAFVALAPHLSEHQLDRALNLLESGALQFENYLMGICALAPRFTDKHRTTVVSSLFAILSAPGSSWIHKAMAKKWQPLLAFYLPPAEREQAIAHNVEKLVDIAGSHNSWPSFADFVEKWPNELALSLLMELPDKCLGLATKAATQITTAAGRAEVLSRIVPRLSHSQQTGILNAELRLFEFNNDKRAQAATIAALFPHLPEAQRSEAAEKAIALEPDKPELISSLAAFLPVKRKETVVISAVNSAKANKDSFAKDSAFGLLSPHIPESEIADAHKEAKKLVANYHYQSLSGLVHRLPKSSMHDAIKEILSAASETAGELPDLFVNSLRKIKKHLNQDEISAVLTIAESLDEHHRTKAWAAIVSYIPIHTLRELHDSALTFNSAYSRAQALCVISPHLPEEERSDAISRAYKTAIELEHLNSRISALHTIASNVEKSILNADLPKILREAMSLTDDDHRAKTLCHLIGIPGLSHSERLSALEEILESSLGLKVKLMIGSNKFRKSLNRSFLLNCICELAEVLEDLGGETLVTETLHAIYDTTSWWP